MQAEVPASTVPQTVRQSSDTTPTTIVIPDLIRDDGEVRTTTKT